MSTQAKNHGQCISTSGDATRDAPPPPLVSPWPVGPLPAPAPQAEFDEVAKLHLED